MSPASPDTTRAITTLATLLRTAHTTNMEQLVSEWDPPIAVLVAAASGDRRAADQLATFLDERAGTEAWAGLAGGVAADPHR